MNAPNTMLGYRIEQQYEFLHNATQWRVFNDDGDDNNNNNNAHYCIGVGKCFLES